MFNEEIWMSQALEQPNRLLSDGGSDGTSAQKWQRTSIFQEKSNRINRRESQRHQDGQLRSENERYAEPQKNHLTD